jgi:uncharacterized damage-inducible protein DinB
MNANEQLRNQISRFLDWEDSHVGFDKAVAGIPVDARGKRVANLPHSLWELLEHIRITQRDILDFCRPGHYTELQWPADYWPPSAEPSAADEWDASIATAQSDRAALQQIVADPTIDLFSLVPHGAGDQTYLREMLVIADHAAYHIGQLITTRKLLEIWPAS